MLCFCSLNEYMRFLFWTFHILYNLNLLYESNNHKNTKYSLRLKLKMNRSRKQKNISSTIRSGNSGSDRQEDSCVIKEDKVFFKTKRRTKF